MQINDIPVKREQMKSFQCRRPHKKMPPNNCIKRCEWSTGERWKMSKFSIHHSRNTEIWQYLIFKIMIQNIYRKNSILIPYQLKVKYQSPSCKGNSYTSRQICYNFKLSRNFDLFFFFLMYCFWSEQSYLIMTGMVLGFGLWPKQC